jgi:DNA-binding FadR family transcriptional regulator
MATNNLRPSPRFGKIKISSAYEKVAEAIENEIIAGRLQPGHEIGTEAELVKKFGVNRSTVREGIRVLEQSGLVLRGAGRKLVVCMPQHKTISTRLSRAMILQEITFMELYDTAMILEVGSAMAAALRAEAKDIEDMEANIEQAEQVRDDPVRLARFDTKFHALLARASQNRVLELAREPPSLLFFPTAEFICRRVPEGAGRMLEAHKKLVQAIRNKDVEAARTWMRRHVADWRKGFERTGQKLDEPIGPLLVQLSQEKT